MSSFSIRSFARVRSRACGSASCGCHFFAIRTSDHLGCGARDGLFSMAPEPQGRRPHWPFQASLGLFRWLKQSESPMAIQIVMDRTGDTRHEFDAEDRAAIEKAEKRFNQLTGAGFTAAVRSGPGEQRVFSSLDPNAEETLL